MPKNWDPVRLVGYPPVGDVDYPDEFNNFIDLLEVEFANELEESRDDEATLFDNIQNLLKDTLTQNIDGGGIFKFTNMGTGTTDTAEYATVAQVQGLKLGMPDVDELTITGPPSFEEPYAEFTTLDSSNFNLFEYNMSSISTSGGDFYPSKLNATFLVNWTGASETLVDLNHALAPIPANGDRLRFIFANTRSGDGIQASAKINGHPDKITFGEVFSVATYDLVYTNSPNTGWLLKNVVLGE